MLYNCNGVKSINASHKWFYFIECDFLPSIKCDPRVISIIDESIWNMLVRDFLIKIYRIIDVMMAYELDHNADLV